MIGVEASPDNFQVRDRNRAKKWGMNFGESENQPRPSGFVTQPSCDAAVQNCWGKETQRNKRKQGKAKLEQWFFTSRHTNVLAYNHARGKRHHSTFAAS